MLTKNELLGLGYTIGEDPDQPGRFYWRNDIDGSEISYDAEADAIAAAWADARARYTLYRCERCGNMETDVSMASASDTAPSSGCATDGRCSNCDGPCRQLDDGEDTDDDSDDWETVMAFFGLDTSFVWTPEQVESYTQQYRDAIRESAAREAASEKALAFVGRVAALKKFGEPGDDGKPFDPIEGADDSHEALMDLIDEAREIAALATPA